MIDPNTCEVDLKKSCPWNHAKPRVITINVESEVCHISFNPKMSGIIDSMNRFEHVSELKVSNVTPEEKKMLLTYLKHVDRINGEDQDQKKKKRLVPTYSPLKK